MAIRSKPKTLTWASEDVVTLEDGETVHNAFPDRDFEEEEPT